jgi:hypothetical protein
MGLSTKAICLNCWNFTLATVADSNNNGGNSTNSSFSPIPSRSYRFSSKTIDCSFDSASGVVEEIAHCISGKFPFLFESLIPS